MHIDENLNWEAHIHQTIQRANKKMGLIWKISEHFPRKYAENIYTLYIRTGLEYGCVLYDSCSKQLKDKFEDTQRRATIACTSTFNRTPTSTVLKELGWPTLEKRRQYMHMLYMFKMKNPLTPTYLRDILPPQQGAYSTWHSNNFIIPSTQNN